MKQLSPFLRFFLQFFGHLAIQLKPIQLHRPGTLINLAWNLLLTYLTLRHILSHLLDGEQQKTAIDRESYLHFLKSMREKPLFSLFVIINNRYLIPASYPLTALYFIAISCKRSQLLDSLNAFQHPTFHCPNASKRIFLRALLLYNLLAWLTLLKGIITECQVGLPWQVILYQTTLNYIFMASRCISFILTHYRQYAISLEIESITVDFQKNPNIDSTKRQLSRLARLSGQLNRLLSFPLLIILLSHITEVLYSLSLFWTSQFQSFNAYLMQPILHLLYIALLERSIDRQLSKLAALLVSDEAATRQYALIGRSSQPALTGRSRLSGALEVVPLYRTQLHLRLFNLFALDWVFVFSVLLFTVNYCVLITQTST